MLTQVLTVRMWDSGAPLGGAYTPAMCDETIIVKETLNSENLDRWTIRCYCHLRRKMALCTLVALRWWRCNTVQKLILPCLWCSWCAVMTKLYSLIADSMWRSSTSASKSMNGGVWHHNEFWQGSHWRRCGRTKPWRSIQLRFRLFLWQFQLVWPERARCTGPIFILSKAVMHTTKSGTCDQMAPDEVGSILYSSILFVSIWALCLLWSLSNMLRISPQKTRGCTLVHWRFRSWKVGSFPPAPGHCPADVPRGHWEFIWTTSKNCPT